MRTPQSSEASRRRLLIIAAGFLVLGVIMGILFQRYYGVGSLRANVASALGAAPTAEPPPEPTEVPRVEVPLSILQSKRTMVALAFGQSNSASHGGSPLGAEGSVYNFHDGRLYQAQDPLLGASGRKGSVWTRLGGKIIDAGLYDAVVFISIGEGSTHIARWTPSGDLHQRILNAIEDASRSGLTITHLLWHQGETDAGLRTTRVQYVAMFEQMASSIREQGIDAPLFVSVATVCGPEPMGSAEEIRRAQIEVVDPEQNIYQGPDTDTLGPDFRDPDLCHFSDAGLERFADEWLRLISMLEG